MQFKDGVYTRSSPDGGYYGALPNDGIFINPMRTNFTPPSPSDSGESFFLHDPQEVIYNRVKDIFESDTSTREEPINQRSNAMTVQAEIHSSSSGAASGSDDEVLEHAKENNLKAYAVEPKAPQASNNHDYEDIYLVREEAKSSGKKMYGRSRSRTDSGSHSRSASTSSTRSHDVVLPNKSSVSETLSSSPPCTRLQLTLPQMLFDKNNRYEVPRKNVDKNLQQQSSQNIDTTYESVGPSDNMFERKPLASSSSANKKGASDDAPPLPPPLPPLFFEKKAALESHNANRNNRDSNDSLADSIDFDQADGDDNSLESDSGLEVVEEPTLRPSELVRGNNNRSMSIISGKSSC